MGLFRAAGAGVPVSDEQGDREPSAVNDGPGWVESDMDCRGEVDHERRLDAAWDEWAELRRDFPP